MEMAGRCTIPTKRGGGGFSQESIKNRARTELKNSLDLFRLCPPPPPTPVRYAPHS